MRRGVSEYALVAILSCGWTISSFAQQSNRLPEEIQVLGERLYYSLNDSPAPSLIYEEEFFQSFEPQSVGDMLKRVSGIAFTSDIGEFEAPQLRGLGPQYTQVLINGVRIPGVNDDRAAFVDRIPAELIDRIEVLRSPGADIDSQGIGGTINLILKQGGDHQGTDWRLGGLYYSDIDSTVKGSASISHAGKSNNWSYSLTATTQDRHGPKTKTEQVFAGGNLLRTFTAEDIRESTDRSMFGTLNYALANDEHLSFRFGYLSGMVDELERLEHFNEDLEFESRGVERRDAEQDRWDIGFGYDKLLSADLSFEFSLSASQFDDDSEDLEAVFEDALEIVELQQFTRTDDLELQIGGAFVYSAINNHRLSFGFGANQEDRDSRQRILELDDEELIDASPASGSYSVEEIRRYIYLKDVWQLSSDETLEFGIRAEDTSLQQRGSDGLTNNSQFELNPSAHYLRNIGASGQLRVSLAKSLRRPNFNELIPFTNRDTPNEDQLTIGNPDLKPEESVGLDLGYSHRFEESSGILGLNAFYREIDNKIELSKIGEDLFTSDNVGRGETWGLEIDIGLPLSFAGLPQLSFFANYTWIDSRISDPFTNKERRFNLQPDFMGNVDFIHSIPSAGFSHGVSFQKQGSVKDIQFDESKRVSYGTNLEYYVEKEVRDNLTIRFSASNLLNARKREHGFIFDGLSDFLTGDIEETVFEREQSEPVFQLTIRGSF